MVLYTVLFDDVTAPALTEITLSASATASAAASDTYIPVDSLTVAEILVESGGASQTRVIVDPTYPGADGNVTWVASDPLTGVSEANFNGYWARYPISADITTNGAWRRDDWNALTVGQGAANAIDLDWCAIDTDDDITGILDAISDHYVNGTIQNVCSIKGPEVATVIIDNEVFTGDGTATEFYWYAPTSTHCVVTRPAFSMGTEDLMAKSWTEDATGQWSASVTETVTWMRIADTNNTAAGNANPAWPGVKVPLAWTANGSEASAAAANTPGLFHYTSGTLTVGAPSSPSTYYDDMDYFQVLPYTKENAVTWTDIHTLYVEGGGSRFGGPGLEFRGRIGLAPQQGRLSTTYESIPPLVAILCSSAFVKAGSECTFLAGTGEAVNCGLNRDRDPWPTGPDTTRRYEKMTLGGIHTSKLDINYAADWLVGYAGGAAGDALELISMWGSANNVGGQLLEAVNADTNGSVAWGNNWSNGHCRNINHVYKFTGSFKGNGLWPFFGGSDGVTPFTLGVSKADPCKFAFRASKLAGIAPADTDYTPNGRPYKIDVTGGWVPNGKFDSLQIERLTPGFMEIELQGAVDRDGTTALAIDLTDALTNQAYDPETTDASVNGGGTVFEATNAFLTGFSDLYVKLKAQNGQGNIDCSVVDYRQPKFNFIGDIEFEGEGEATACYAGLHNCGVSTHVHDFLFKNRPDDAFNFGEASVWMAADGGGQTNFSKKPQDLLIEDCTFESSQIVRVGKNASVPPYNVDLNNVTFEGTSRTVIKVVPYGYQGSPASNGTTRGHPIVIKANNVTGWGTGSAVVIDAGLNGDDIYFSPDNGISWFGLPWTKDGTQTAKSPPRAPVSLNLVWEEISNQNSASIEMPAFVSDNDDVIVALYFDADPGTFTVTSSFTEISAAAANTSANDLYAKFFRRRFATGTDAWDTDGFDLAETFTWTNSANLVTHSINYRGGHATTLIGSNSTSSVDNTGATSVTAPTITADNAGSILLYFFGTPGGVDVDSFSGGPGGHIMPLCKHESTTDAFGVQNANVGYAFAQVYAESATSRTGLTATFSASTRSIATTIELKPGPLSMVLSGTVSGAAEMTDTAL